MRFHLMAAIVGLLLWIVLDLYVSLVMLRKRGGLYQSRVVKYCWWGVSGVAVISLILAYLFSTYHHETSAQNTAVMWLIFTFLTLLGGTLVLVLCDIISYIPRLIRRPRAGKVTAMGLFLAVGVCLVMWWGALINRNRISVTEITVESSDWPKAFDGYRIIQLSDLHSGTWSNDTAFMSRLVDKVNSLRPDLIVFTGDIVNSSSGEFVPMVSTFARLQAPDGVYAVMGNHDYGDYHYWPSQEAHEADRRNLKRLYDLTGHTLLLNESAFIRRGGDSIAIVGVENIGEPPFSIYGSLPRAYPTLEDSVAKILLSHNPSHWVDSIRNNEAVNIPLTLSGHTHAMQLQVGGFTPASWRYETPWGRYDDTLGHALYVNRGAGTVGMPMRIGATPEITVITLKSL